MTSSRALSLLAGVASALFMCAAIAGWLYGFWPANPFTLGVAAFAVVSGPLLGIYHVATADESIAADELELAPVVAPVINMAEARARAFHNWRDSVHPAIERRERERRASQYIRL